MVIFLREAGEIFAVTAFVVLSKLAELRKGRAKWSASDKRQART